MEVRKVSETTLDIHLNWKVNLSFILRLHLSLGFSLSLNLSLEKMYLLWVLWFHDSSQTEMVWMKTIILEFVVLSVESVRAFVLFLWPEATDCKTSSAVEWDKIQARSACECSWLHTEYSTNPVLGANCRDLLGVLVYFWEGKVFFKCSRRGGTS